MTKLTFSQDKAKNYTLYYLLLVVLAFSRSLIAYVFIISNGFAPGGVGGISSIMNGAVLSRFGTPVRYAGTRCGRIRRSAQALCG